VSEMSAAQERARERTRKPSSKGIRDMDPFTKLR
jgi:hypothetical protein